MFNTLKGKLDILSIAIIVSLAFVYVSHERWVGWNGVFWKTTINSDGRGYYAYLPAVFIYHDLSYKFVSKVEKDIVGPENVGNFLNEKDGLKFNKYFIGVAILNAPFFSAAYGFSKIFNHDLDGYSKPFQYSVSIAALFYLALGLLFISKLLKSYDIKQTNIALTILALFFGTNLFYYATMEPAMSHVYSFSLISIFLYYSRKLFQSYSRKTLLFTTLTLVLIILIRPSNFIIVSSLPFLAGGFSSFKQLVPQILRVAIKDYLFIIVIALLFIQPLFWYLQTGHFFIWSYKNEGFNFFSPHIFDILLSYRKGLFVYTPLMFFAVIGTCFLFKMSRQIFYSFWFSAVVIVYVVASWWNWYYGGSFGLRAFIDFYSLMAIPLSLLIQNLGLLAFRMLVFLIISACVYINVIQIDQYNRYILHMDSMNKERFWKIFLKTGKEYEGIFYKNENDVVKTNEAKTEQLHNNIQIQNSLEKDLPDWQNDEKLSSTISHSEKYSSYVNTSSVYSATFAKSISAEDTLVNRVKVSVWAFLKNVNTDAQLVVSIENKSGVYSWNNVFLKDVIAQSEEWKNIQLEAVLSHAVKPMDVLKVYVYESKGEVYIDDFTFDLIAK